MGEGGEGGEGEGSATKRKWDYEVLIARKFFSKPFYWLFGPWVTRLADPLVVVADFYWRVQRSIGRISWLSG